MARRKKQADFLDIKAAEALNSIYAQSMPKQGKRHAGRQSQHSWQDVALELGFNVGYIYNVAHKEKQASNKLLHALGLPMRTVEVAPCPKCGQPPLTKHHRCPGAAPKPRKPTKSARRKRLIHDECWRMCYHSFSKMKG